MDIIGAQEVVERSGSKLLSKAFSDVLRSSEEHPETKGREVSKIEFLIKVSYKDTTAQTVCAPVLYPMRA